MKRQAVVGLLFCLALACHAQEGPIPGALIDVVPSAPSGSCFQDLPDQQVAITGLLYSCQNGTWDLIGGPGGSPGAPLYSVQWNDQLFAGDSTFTFNNITKTVGANNFFAGDGIHASLISAAGGALDPPIPPNTVSDMGPDVASFVAYAKQWPSAGPLNGSVVCGGALSQYSISQMAFCLPINPSNGELGFVNSAGPVTIASDSIHAGASFLACNLFDPILPPHVQGWAGSTASSTCASYGLNVPSLAPSYGSNIYGFMLHPGVTTAGGGTNNYSQSIWSQITTDPTGSNLSIPGTLNVAGVTTLATLETSAITINPVPQSIASATTIAPTTPQVVISGTTAIVNVTVPGSTTTASTTKTCAAQTVSGSNTATCTWSTALASGETGVCGLSNAPQYGTTFAVTDNIADTWIGVGTVYSTIYMGVSTQAFYYSPASPVTSTTVTVSGEVGNNLTILCQSFTGGASPPVVDGYQCAADANSGTSVTCGTAITTTQPGDYVFCVASSNRGGGNTLTPGSGFTGGSTIGAINLAQYKVQGAAGTLTPNMTMSLGGTSTMECTAFKAPTPGSVSFAGCFDSLATGAWTTTTAGNIENAITASSDSSYHWCYWPGISAWTVK
jgi:hypothetical protein